MRQPILPSPKVPLRPSPRFRRVGRNRLDSQLLHGSPDLRRPALIYLAPSLRRVEEMAASVAVQRAEQSLPLDHFPETRHYRQGRFFFHQLRVVDLAGGVVQYHDQVVIPIILKPSMFTAIHVQQHSRQRPAWTSPPM